MLILVVPWSARLSRPHQDPGVDPGIGRRAAEHRDHGGDLAAVVGCVIGDMLQQRAQRRAEGPAFRVLVLHHPAELGVLQAIDERRLLGLERVPLLAHEGHRRQLGARLRGRRRPLPAAQPDPLGAVEVREHPRHLRMAELDTDLARARPLAERGGDVEELAVRPAMVLVEVADHRHAHRASSWGHSSTTTVSPSCTVCPSRTRISFTAPARGASTGISIFMDSSTITGSPAATLSPTFAVTWKTTPVICALISSAMERSLFDHLSVHPAAAEIRV